MDFDEVMRKFDQLDGKIEALIDQCKSLEMANSQLRKKGVELESALAQKNEAENQHFRHKELIRSKIDNLLAKLEGTTEIIGAE